MGPERGGAGGRKTLPIKLVQSVRKCILSLCLLPRPSLTKYPVFNSRQCNGGNPFMPIRWVNLSGTILPLVNMLFDLADFRVDVITLL